MSFFFFKQKTAYEMRISDWSSGVCSSDLDEFAVVLAEADVRGARTVAERIRTRFLEERGEAAAAQHCTLSIGLAEADRLLIDADDWVRRADAAMYRAKADGRDRVNVA